MSSSRPRRLRARVPGLGLGLALGALALAAAGGCEPVLGLGEGASSGSGDGGALDVGEPLGTFHVTATRLENTCGEGALGSAPLWEFDVALAREEGTIFWSPGDAAPAVGRLAADGRTFALEASVRVDMSEGTCCGRCAVVRTDVVSGELGAGEGGEVTAFDARMGFSFSPERDSICDELVTGSEPTFAALPCSMSYDLRGLRTEAPESGGGGAPRYAADADEPPG